MIAACFLNAMFVAALELERRTMSGAGLPLFSVAGPLLLFWLARSAPHAQPIRLATTTIVHLAWALVLHHDSPWQAIAGASGTALGATAAIWALRVWTIDVRLVRTVSAASRLLVACTVAAVIATATSTVPTLVVHGRSAADQLWSLRLAAELLGTLTIAPLAITGPRGLRTAVRGRWLEATALLVGTVVVTQFVWAQSAVPRPALLVPLYVWAAVRFQLAGGLMNLTFEAIAIANWLQGRGPWIHARSPEDASAVLWLHVVAIATFLLLSVGVLERRRAQQLAARVLDGVHEGILVVDDRGIIKTANREAARMFGRDVAATTGRSVQDVLSASIDVTAARGGDIDVEIVAARADGSPFPARVTLSPVPSDDERHVLAIVRDLSRQREHERSLEASEAQLRAVLAALPDTILIHDREGRSVGFHVSPRSTSPAATASTAEPEAGALSPVEAEALESARQRVLATKTPEFLEFSLTRDGQSRWMESRLVPLGEDRTLNVLRDVTERRQLQAELRQAQKLEAIGRLAGGVAHDFNNLLTVIGGSTELVLDALPAADGSRRFLQDVREATARATLLTQQLLAFGRRQVLQAHVFDLPEVVRGCEQMLARLIGEHITLTCTADQAVPPVRADRGQVEQVIVNLVVNARDAMPAGGRLDVGTRYVTVTDEACHTNRQLRPGRFVCLSVADTGSGIPAEVIEHIFEPFFTTKASGRGTGLGLATVYGIVQQSDGFIAVDSRPGAGTTFSVYLPAVDGPTSADAAVPPATPARRGEETILLVEDETAVREVALRFLAGAGYHVLPAANGQDALDIARGHAGAIHLLLTDVVMPGLSGPELAAVLRRRHTGLPVIFMSGYPNDALHAHQVPDDTALFIQKPFSRQVLLDSLQTALGAPA